MTTPARPEPLFIQKLNSRLAQSTEARVDNVGNLRPDAKSTRRGNMPLVTFPGTDAEGVTNKQIVDTEVHTVLRDFVDKFAGLWNKDSLPDVAKESLEKINQLCGAHTKSTKSLDKFFNEVRGEKGKVIYGEMSELVAALNIELMTGSVEKLPVRSRSPQFFEDTAAIYASLLEEKEPAQLWEQRNKAHEILQAINATNAEMKASLENLKTISKQVETVELGGVLYKNIDRKGPKYHERDVNWLMRCFHAETAATALVDTMKTPIWLNLATTNQFHSKDLVIGHLIQDVEMTEALDTGIPLRDNPHFKALNDDALVKTQIALTCCGKRPKTAAAAEALLQQEKERACQTPEERGPSHWAEYDDLMQEGCKDYLILAGINNKEEFDTIAEKHRMAVIGKWLDKSKQNDKYAAAVANGSEVVGAPKGKCPFGYDSAPTYPAVKSGGCPFNHG